MNGLKKVFCIPFCLLLILGFTLPEAYADDIRLGVPGYGGTGCPAGTASATLSPDRKSLSILFDEYVVAAGGSLPSRVGRKTCNIAIPVHIPQGFSLSIVDVDYRGYLFLPRGATARFNVEYFFAGIRGPRYSTSFRGFSDRNYLLDNTLGLATLVWSRCGDDVNLRVNSSMVVLNYNRATEAMATVDTADFKAGIIYRLAWKRC